MTTFSAIVLADSRAPTGERLTTLQLRYPRFIHSEFLTHRMFSRNSSSSRAIPVERLIADVESDPAMPIHWGANEKGMQAREECDELVDMPTPYREYDMDETREDAWKASMEYAVVVARAFTKSGYHKQIVNRLLEPFAHINTVVTADEAAYSAFLSFRDHPDAQPEMQALAVAIRNALEASQPLSLSPGQWHLPYISDTDRITERTDQELAPISAARCARTSYKTHDGQPTTHAADAVLFDKLLNCVPWHPSPLEHQATPVPGQHANFIGWKSQRRFFEEQGQ